MNSRRVITVQSDPQSKELDGTVLSPQAFLSHLRSWSFFRAVCCVDVEHPCAHVRRCVPVSSARPDGPSLCVPFRNGSLLRGFHTPGWGTRVSNSGHPVLASRANMQSYKAAPVFCSLVAVGSSGFPPYTLGVFVSSAVGEDVPNCPKLSRAEGQRPPCSQHPPISVKAGVHGPQDFFVAASLASWLRKTLTPLRKGQQVLFTSGLEKRCLFQPK